MNKNRHTIGELQAFFRNNDASKAINSISTIMNSIRIQSKVFGSVKNPNCKFTCLQVLQLLLLFPFFSVKNAANYSSSAQQITHDYIVFCFAVPLNKKRLTKW